MQRPRQAPAAPLAGSAGAAGQAGQTQPVGAGFVSGLACGATGLRVFEEIV